MAWTKVGVGGSNKDRNMEVYMEELVTLPSSAAAGLTSVMDFLPPIDPVNPRTIKVAVVASDLESGEYLDVDLYATYEPNGTKYKMKTQDDASGNVTADLTPGSLFASGGFELNDFPAAELFISFTPNQDESDHTRSCYVMVQNSVRHRLR